MDILDDLGNAHMAAIQRQNLANLLAEDDRVDEAGGLARNLVGTVLRLGDPNLTLAFANTYMNILLRQGDPVRAAHLFGAEEGMRERLALPNPYVEEELEEALALVDGVMSPAEWDQHRQLGREELLEDLLAQLESASKEAGQGR